MRVQVPPMVHSHASVGNRHQQGKIMRSYRIIFEHESERHARAAELKNHLEAFSEVQRCHPGARVLLIQEMRSVGRNAHVSGDVKYCIDENLLLKDDERVRELTPYEIVQMEQETMAPSSSGKDTWPTPKHSGVRVPQELPIKLDADSK